MSTEFMISIPNPPQYDAVIDPKLENSIFHDMYYGALRNVEDIINRNNQIFSRTTKDLNNLTAENATINTVIAFVGGRGTGKSSAMQSFRAFLHDFSTTTKNNISGVKLNAGNETFYPLSTIDSSQISEKETVLGRMSAAMLEEFENCLKDLSVEQKQNFMRCAKEVNELSVMIRDGEWFRCGDKLLTDTRRLCNMRNKVCELVNLYLKIVDKSYLVITIDDLDMSIPNAHAIMEEIRQYLSIPHVIVLVSLDEDLLDAVMNAAIANSFGEYSKGSVHKPVVKDLAYRYLEKLFPVNRRHYTPSLNAKQLREWKADFYGNQDNAGKFVIRDAILQLIWRKTMMLPVCNRDGDHLLIPRNLRSLYNMVVLLRNMPDVVYRSGSSDLRTREDFAKAEAMEIREQLRNNLKVFGQYIVANIASYGTPQLNDKIEIGMVKVLENIIRQMMEVSLTHMNALIVGDILYYVSNIENDHGTYKLNFRDYVGKCAKFELLSPAIQYPDAISLGDVMFVLGELDSCSKCSYIRYLAEVIRTLWSVRMTEELFVTYTQGSDGNITKTTEAFRRVVGGFIVNPDYMDEFLENGGWKEYDHIVDTVGAEMARYMSSYQGKANSAWRESRQGARAYYHIESYSKEKGIWCHPFAIYSHLLDEPLEGVDLVLPFYSLDFMYRYYEELQQNLRSHQANKMCFEDLAETLFEKDSTNMVHIINNILGIDTFKGGSQTILEDLKKSNKVLCPRLNFLKKALISLKGILEEYISDDMDLEKHPVLWKQINDRISEIENRTTNEAEAIKRTFPQFKEKFITPSSRDDLNNNIVIAQELLDKLKNQIPDND